MYLVSCYFGGRRNITLSLTYLIWWSAAVEVHYSSLRVSNHYSSPPWKHQVAKMIFLAIILKTYSFTGFSFSLRRKYQMQLLAQLPDAENWCEDNVEDDLLTTSNENIRSNYSWTFLVTTKGGTV